jgi:hypothetical protein
VQALLSLLYALGATELLAFAVGTAALILMAVSHCCARRESIRW